MTQRKRWGTPAKRRIPQGTHNQLNSFKLRRYIMHKTVLTLTVAFGCLFLSLLITINVVHSAHVAVRYYRHLSLPLFNRIILTYPIDPDSSESINCYKVKYDQYGRITEISHQIGGRLSFDSTKSFAKLEIEYLKHNETWRLFDEMLHTINHSNISYSTFVTDPHSFQLTQLFYSADNNLTTDTIGVSKYLVPLDSLFRPISRFALSAEDDTIYDNLGAYEIRYKYDSNDNLTDELTFGKSGRKSINTYGFHLMHIDYDNYRNKLSVCFCDTLQSPAINNQYMAHSLHFKYDHIGNITSTAFRDEYNNPIFNQDMGFAVANMEYFDKGSIRTIKSYNHESAPLQTVIYNEFGKIIGIDVYSSVDKLYEYINEDYYFYRDEVNDYEQLICRSFYDIDGNYYRLSKGYSYYCIKYDLNQKPTEISYYDEEKRLTIAHDLGAAIVESKYDSRGNGIELRYLDVNRKSMINLISGYSLRRREFNESNRVVFDGFFDSQNKPIFATKEGYATMTIKYDEYGRPVESRFYDEFNKLTDSRGGAAIVRLRYGDSESTIPFDTVYFNEQHIEIQLK